MVFSTAGALFGLGLAVLLILLRTAPVYGLLAGALLGGLAGCIGTGVAVGCAMESTVSAMIGGAADMMPSVLRILASGVLAGALTETGAAERLASDLTRLLGVRRAVTAAALAAAVICAAGVFADIAVITVAPVALILGKRAGVSREGILLAMIGGVKAGNLVSPNPNTIAAAEAFGVDLTALMLENVLPAVLAFGMTVFLASRLGKKGTPCVLPSGDPESSGALPDTKTASDAQTAMGTKRLPGTAAAVCGPFLVLALLALRPLCGVEVDPLIALPAGGLLCVLATKNGGRLSSVLASGAEKVLGAAVLLIGTGALSGIISASALQTDMIRVLDFFRLPAVVLAPVSGILLGAAAASTTAGAAIASRTFASVLTGAGVPAVRAAAMIHAGATVFDSLPHGSFFHATGGAVFMDTRARMRLLLREALIGGTGTAAAVLFCCLRP